MHYYMNVSHVILPHKVFLAIICPENASDPTFFSFVLPEIFVVCFNILGWQMAMLPY